MELTTYGFNLKTLRLSILEGLNSFSLVTLGKVTKTELRQDRKYLSYSSLEAMGLKS